jgi:predicted site-specific integrase-resolvase
MLNVKEFALFMGVSTRTVRRWMCQGLPFVRVVQIIRIDKLAAMAWIEAQRRG